MRVVVRAAKGARHVFDNLEPSETVQAFKARIFAQTGVVALNQRLSYRGQRMKIGERLSDYGMRHRTTGDIVVDMFAFDFVNEAVAMAPTIFALTMCSFCYNAWDQTSQGFGLGISTSSAAGSLSVAFLGGTLIVLLTWHILGSNAVPNRAEHFVLTPLGLVAGVFFSKAAVFVRKQLLDGTSRRDPGHPLPSHWEYVTINITFMVFIVAAAVALSVWATRTDNRQREFADARKNKNRKAELAAREAFRTIDSDHSGTLSYAEVKIAVVQIRRKGGEAPLAEAELVQICADMDWSSKGVISEKQFIGFMLEDDHKTVHEAFAHLLQRKAEYNPLVHALAKITGSFLVVTVGRTFNEFLMDLWQAQAMGVLGSFFYGLAVNLSCGALYYCLRFYTSAVQTPADAQRTTTPDEEKGDEPPGRSDDAELRELFRHKNIFLAKMSLVMAVRFSYFNNVVLKIDKLGGSPVITLGWDCLAMLVLAFLVSVLAFLGQEFTQLVEDHEKGRPELRSFPREFAVGVCILALSTLSMQFGTSVFLVVQDPVMAIPERWLRCAILWLLSAACAGLMVYYVKEQHKKIVMEFRKDVMVAQTTQKATMKFKHLLKKKAPSGIGGTAQEKSALLPVKGGGREGGKGRL